MSVPATKLVIPYRPHTGGQIQFHQARDKQYRCLACGARWGKDRCTVNEMWAVASQIAAWKLEHASAFRTVMPLVHVWIVAPDFPREKQFWLEMQTYIPPSAVVSMTNNDYTMMCSITRDRKPQIKLELKSAKDPRGLVSAGIDLLVMTEAALIKDEAWDMYLQPRLISPGRAGNVIANGTPKGRNWYYRFFNFCRDNPDVAWCLQAPSWTNPLIDPEKIRDLERKMPRLAYRQEMGAEFLSETGGVFHGVRDAAKRTREVKGPIIIGIDWGKRRDASVFAIMSVTGQMLALHHFEKTKYGVQLEHLKEIYTALLAQGWTQDDIIIVPERNSIGEVMCELIEAEFPVSAASGGFYTTGITKRDIIDELAVDIEDADSGICLLDDPELLNQLEIFEYSQLVSGWVSFHAPVGETLHDDYVMAVAIANHARNTAAAWYTGNGAAGFQARVF